MEREEFTLAHDVVQKQNPESKNDRKHENERERESGGWEGGADASGRLILAPLEDVCWRRQPGYRTSWGRGPVLGPADGAIGRVSQESSPRGRPILDSEGESWGEFCAPSACLLWPAARRSPRPCGEERCLSRARSAKSMGDSRVTGSMQPGILIHPWTRAAKHWHPGTNGPVKTRM